MMKVKFERSFEKDLKKLKDRNIRKKVKEVIEMVESIKEIGEFKGDLRKIRTSPNLWRIRIGDYRIGLRIEKDTVIFVRVLHRRDIYKYFP